MYVTKEKNTDTEPARDRSAISPDELTSFRLLFREWLEEGSNLQALESGGLGDLEALAHSIRSWAISHPSKR